MRAAASVVLLAVAGRALPLVGRGGGEDDARTASEWLATEQSEHGAAANALSGCAARAPRTARRA